MKILILGFTKIKFMPYINFYLDAIDVVKNEVHVLYWNRDLKDEDLSAFSNVHLHEFSCYQEDDISKLSKIKSFLKYRKFTKSVLKDGHFDFLFVLHSLPGIVVIDILKAHYKNRYILDYRDSTYEQFAPFKKCVWALVRWSAATFVSSDAFRRYLPPNMSEKTFTSHNILMDSLAHSDDKEKTGIYSEKIRIAFWGFIRHEAVNKILIDRLANDCRFELHYYGREQQIALNLKAYAKSINAINVFFHGEYKPEDRYEFILNTDIIHNLYFDNNMMFAMGNKYYDGIIFKIPQLCMPGSYMSQMCKEHNVGISLNPEELNFADSLYQYYATLNIKEFHQSCIKETDRVVEEYAVGKNVILEKIYSNVK